MIGIENIRSIYEYVFDGFQLGQSEVVKNY